MQGVYQLGALPEDVQNFLDRVAVGISLGFDGLGSLLRCTGLASPVNVLTFWLVAPITLTLVVSAAAMTWAAVSRRNGPSWLREAMLWSLRPALLIAFGSYPIVASAAFQAFACESLGDVSMRYLPPSYSLECGPVGEPTPEYQSLQTIATLAIAIYPVGISLCTALLLYLAREPLRAGRSTDFTRAISFLHGEYEPDYFWWELVEQQKKLLLVGFAVFVTPGSIGQLVFGLLFSMIFFHLSVECRPFLHDSDDSLASVFSFTMIFFFSCLLVFKVQILVQAVDETLSEYFMMQYNMNTVVLSFGMFAALLGGLAISVSAFLRHLHEMVKAARVAAAAEREAAAARGRMSHPPRCAWQLQPGNKYCTFLSHFKVRDTSCLSLVSTLSLHCPSVTAGRGGL